MIKNQKKLRLGITTGTCSAAAAQAAAMQLLLGVESHAVTLRTPKGMTVSVPVYLLESDSRKASYKVVKDSGDDPDVTNGTDVCVTVAYAKQRVREQTDGSAELDGSVGIRGSKKSSGRVEMGLRCNNHESQDRSWAFTSESFPYLTLDGGIGIGRVTKEGLEQAVGQAAINRVPRQMIFAAVADVCEKANVCEPLHITVWMPEGETLAKRTFNPKLGIEGGLSILGTSGILEPMSEQAIVATIETEIRQLHAVGEEKVLVTPGNYGQAYASEYLGLDLAKSVKSSNYIGDTIDLAISYGMKDFLLVGNIGKLVKLAAGIFNTHSKVADGRGEIFAVHAAMAGAGADVVQEIYNCINTDRMLDVVEREGLRKAVMQSILAAIEKHVAGRIGDAMRFGVIVFSEKYGYLGQTADTAVLDVFRGKLQM
ncbi:cobalt-precorrin-5B (C(1))-methyltransferase CbiD [Eubacterium sp. MSJ-21]|nr:cobalt-precorrin-5B (C(1))-methyltransferase CbiD [Eubacterium sp. MSJ-21]